MKKGIIGIVIAVILIGVAVGTTAATLLFTEKFSSKLTIEVSFLDKQLMEDKLHFDSEKWFLENSLLVAGAYAAHENGLNGTIYKNSWDRLEGFDLNGNWFSYVCWKDLTGDKIPPENMVTEGVGDRTNETYQSYFSNLDYVTIEGMEPLQMENNENEFNFSYLITELNLSGEFLNHTMREKNVLIKTTIPARYIMIYRDAKDFTENSDVKLDDELIGVLNHVQVCTGDGTLTQARAIQLMQEELINIASDLESDYPGTDWELELLKINSFVQTQPPTPNPAYRIGFTIKVVVNDSDLERRATTTDSLEKIRDVFAIESEISFVRIVEKLCDSCTDCTGNSNCGDPGIPPHCSGNSRVWWANIAATEDCVLCYCEKSVSCNPLTCCGAGNCVNTDTDENNCGSCGNVCAAGRTCCSGRCVNTDTDENNCGRCGRRCDADETCIGGSCVPSAPPPPPGPCAGCACRLFFVCGTPCGGACCGFCMPPFFVCCK